MKPNPDMVRLAVVLSTAIFVALFAWLLVDTARASATFDPNPLQLFLTPIFSGALGLILALSLGVEPGPRAAQAGIWSYWTIARLLTAAACIYLLAAIVGGVVWALNIEETPELVTAMVLTVAGYLAAALTAAARAPASGGSAPGSRRPLEDEPAGEE